MLIKKIEYKKKKWSGRYTTSLQKWKNENWCHPKEPLYHNYNRKKTEPKQNSPLSNDSPNTKKYNTAFTPTSSNIASTCVTKWHIQKPFQRGYRLYTSESDVWRRQILTYKYGPRTEKNIYFQWQCMTIQMKREELTKTFMVSWKIL